MTEGLLTARQEWERGWKLVLACFVGFSFFSIMSNTIGVVMGPLTAEFGWSRTLISAGVMISSFITAIFSPFFGILIDRFGSRRLALPGLIAAIVAICSFALTTGSATQWIVLWIVYAVISISIKTTVWTAAIVKSFKQAQGLALGVILTGTAVAQTIMPPLATWLIDAVGWRMMYVALASGWGGVTLLLCWFFLHEVDRAPASAIPSAIPASRRDLAGLSIRQAWRDTALWRIGLSSLIIMTLTIGLLIHQIPILTEAGASRSNAAWLASLAGLAGIGGKLASGILLDRFHAKWVGGFTLAVTSLCFVLLLEGVRSPALIVTAMVISGYSAGSKLQIASYLTARYGGLRHFGAIYGLMTSLIALGSGVGPMIAGFIYDSTGKYETFLISGAVGCVLCGLLLFSLPAYPEFRPSEN